MSHAHALALLAFTTLAAAQAPVAFDPFQHLDGFEACAFDEHADAYEVRTFQALRGEKVTPARLDELRVLWRAARERGEARKTKIAADPRQAALFRIERKLRKDPFFSRLDWVVDDTHLPYAFLLQQAGADPGRVRTQIQRYLPWFEAAAARLRDEILIPAGAKLAEASPCMTVLVLASPGGYAEFAGIHRNSGYYPGPARWTQAFDTLVVPADLPADPLAARAVLEFAQGELAVSLLHKCSGGTLGLRPLWLVAGLPAWARRAGAPARDVPAFGPDANVEQYVAMLLDPVTEGHVGPFEEIAVIDDRGFRALENLAGLRGGGERKPGERNAITWRAFWVQASLWTHYLLQHHRDAFLACVRAALDGKDGRDTLRAGFTAAATAALEPAFAAWVRAEHMRLRAALRLPDPLPLPRRAGSAAAKPTPGTTTTEPPTPTQPTPAQPTAAATPATQPIPRPDPAALALAPAEWSLALAAALATAGQGKLAAALASLRSITPPPDDPAAGARLERERTRLAFVIEQRRKLFEAHVANKKVLDIVFGTERARGRVEAVADATATLRVGGDARGVDLDALDPAQLDLVLRRLTVLASKSWASAYLQLLAERNPDKVRGKLAGGDPEATALAADLEGYPPLFAHADAAHLLTRVVGAATDTAGLSALEELVQKHAAQPFVAERRDGLRTHAAALLASTFDPARTECLGVAGKVEFLPAGRLRVTYAGGEQAQIGDFLPEPAYLSDLIYPDLVLVDIPPAMTAARGAFELLGRGALRLALPFATPLKVTCRMADGERGLLNVGICDDREGSCLLTASDGSILVVIPHQTTRPKRGSQDTYGGERHTLEIEHDGTRVKTSVDGRESLVLPAPAALSKGGDVLLHLSARTACRIETMSIEASLDATRLPALRARFVARRLGEIFGR